MVVPRKTHPVLNPFDENERTFKEQYLKQHECFYLIVLLTAYFYHYINSHTPNLFPKVLLL